MPPVEHFNRQEFQEALRRAADRAAIELTDLHSEQLEAYYRLPTHGKRRINLTALPMDEISGNAIERLLVEPLAAAQHFSRDNVYWMDLGSGGGSPAIPLKVVRPSAVLTMIEAR